MTPLAMTLLAVGAIVNSVLYFVFVMTVALATRNHGAAIADIVAVGVTYLSYSVQLAYPESSYGRLLVFVSIGIGAVAGLSLLM